MLEKLTIKQFQCHGDLELFFDAPIISLIGRSDAGKSAILRSLRWVALNRPAGDAFRKDGSEETSAALVVDGRKIVRTKGDSANGYSLDGKTFKAFGQDVPQDVADLLRVSELNWSLQHQPHFWLGLSPGQVSRELNALVNLDAMDASLSSVSASLRKAAAAVEVGKDRLTAARGRRDALDWVPALDADLIKLEQENYALSLIRSRIARVASCVEKGDKAEIRFQTASRAISDARKAVAVGERAAELRKRVDSLQDILDKLENSIRGTAEGERQLMETRAELERLGAAGCPLCGSTIKMVKSG